MSIVSIDQSQDAYGQSLADFCFNGIPEYGPDRVVRVAFRVEDRRAIEGAVERLIAILDALDGDPDLEPSFGSDDEREGDLDAEEGDGDPDEEDAGDAEPTMGAIEARNGQSQERWAMSAYGLDEIEEENEHGGRHPR